MTLRGSLVVRPSDQEGPLGQVMLLRPLVAQQLALPAQSRASETSLPWGLESVLIWQLDCCLDAPNTYRSAWVWFLVLAPNSNLCSCQPDGEYGFK